MSDPQEQAPLLTLYAIRNQEGKWFRAKGISGGGLSWVDTLAKAKIYPRIGQARSRVTFFANNYPQYGVPDVVCLHVDRTEVLNETERVRKATQKKKEAVERRKVAQKKYLVAQATRDLEAAQAKLKQVTEG